MLSALFATTLLGIGVWFLWQSIASVFAGQQQPDPVQPHATRVWDGGGGDANWSTCANWDTDTCPVADDTIVFDGSAGGTPNDDSTWDSAFSVSQIASITVSTYSGVLTFTKTPVTITGTFSHTSTGNVVFTSTASVTVGGAFTLTTSGTFTANTSTLTLTGTANFDSAKTFNNLAIDSTTNDKTVTTVNSSPTASGTFTVNTGDTLAIGSGLTVTTTTASTVSLGGTIAGPGMFVYQGTSTFATSGTLTAPFRYDMTNGAQTVVARTYGGNVEIYSTSSTSRTATTQGTTITFSGSLLLRAEGTNNVILSAEFSNPTMVIAGDLDYTGSGAGNERINASGTGTWTVSGNVDFTGGTAPTFTTNNTFVMDGTTKTLTANGVSFYNLTLSGSITFGADTTVLGNATLTGTITPGTRALRMQNTAGATQTLIGGGNTLYQVIVNGTNNVVQLTTSDLTISTSLIVGSASDGNTDVLEITSGRTLTLPTVPSLQDGTDSLTGAGLVVETNSSGFSTTGVISVDVRQDVTNSAATQPGRTFGGDYECYSSHASTARSCTFGTGASQTVTIQGNLTLQAASGGDVSVTGATQNPTVAITGTIDYTGPAGGNDESITTGTGAWSAAGVDFRDGNFTATAGNTFTLTGTSNNVYCNGKTFVNLTVNPSSTGTVTFQDDLCTVSTTLSIGANGTLAVASNMNLVHTGATFTLTGTIGGAGSIYYYSSTAFPTTGIVSIDSVTFIPDNNDQIVTGRTYGGSVVVANASASTRAITLGSAAGQTLSIGGNLLFQTGGVGGMTISATANNPAVTVTGNLTFDQQGGAFTTASGSGTWTVSGSADLTNSVWTSSAGNSVVMNGTGTLTTAGRTLGNLTLSGTVTLANATHTMTGDLSLAGGTITAGSSTVTMTGTSNTLTGGSATLTNLTIDPSSAGTVTLQTSDLTVSGTLTVASGDILSLSASRTLTLSGNSGTTLSLSGTVSGAGRLTYQNSATTLPTGGTLSSVVRFDMVNGAMTVPVRTYGGDVEVFNSTSSSRTATPASGTHPYGALLLIANGTGDVTFAGATNNPTVNVTGDVDFTGTGGGTEVITSGTGTWTISGDANFSGGTFTATSGNTLALNGTSKTVTPGGNAFHHLTVSAGSIALGGTTTVNGNLTLSGGTLTSGASAMTVTGTGTLSGGSYTLGSGTQAFTGLLSVTNGTLTHANGTLTADGGMTVDGGTFTGSSGVLDVNGDFTLSSGTFTAPSSSGTFTVTGAFAHASGTFTANGGRVTLDGGNQTVSGTTTFKDLTKTVATARTLTFPAGATQTVTGTLTLQGASGALLSLRSSSTGTQWKIDPQGTRTTQYLDVKDSNNINATAITTIGKNITNSGNNTGWAFPPTDPSGLAGTAISSTAITWTWTDNSSDEDGFRLLDTNGATITSIAAGTTSVTETGLTRGTAYSRKVIAYAGSADSNPTSTVSVTTRASAPTAPTLTDPTANAFVNSLTPTFAFTRATDDDDGMGEYTVATTDAVSTANNFAFDDPDNGTTTYDTFAVTADATTIEVAVTTAGLFAEGALTWEVTATDAAGNTATTDASAFTVDVTKPLLGTVTVSKTVSTSGTDIKTTARTPTLTIGLTDNLALDALSLTFAKRNFLLGEEIDPTNQFSDTVDVSGTTATATYAVADALAYGKYRVTFVTTDSAGNASTATRNIEVITAGEVTPTDDGTDTDGSEEPTTPVVPVNSVPTPDEQEEIIDDGGIIVKTPDDLTLPSLEKVALLRRAREASQFRTFLERFVSAASLDRFETRLQRFVDGTNDTVVTAFRSVGTGFARIFGFSKRHFAALGDILTKDSGALREATTRAPLIEQLDAFLPRFIGRSIIAVKAAQERTLQWLVAARHNRFALAKDSERGLQRVIDPVLRVGRWVAIGARVAYDGIRGKEAVPLAISDVAITKIDATSATISWKTNRPTQGKVNWGPTLAYGADPGNQGGEAFVNDFAQEHSVRIEPLGAKTKYYFEVLATDLKGNDTFDAYYSFTTP